VTRFVSGILCGVGSLLREAEEAGFVTAGNLETRTPYITGRSLCWDLNFTAPLMRQLDYGVTDFMEPDLVLGHPPCGSHSVLGQSGLSVDRMTADERAAREHARGQRMGLLPYFCEMVNIVKPKMFMLDNLPKILKTVGPKEWWESMLLHKYHITPIVIANWDYGTPQLRVRLWIVGVRKPGKPFVFEPIKGRPKGAPRNALEAFRGLSMWPWENDHDLAHVHVEPPNKLTSDYRTTVRDFKPTHAAMLALGYMSIPPNRAWPYLTEAGRLATKIGRLRASPVDKCRVLTGLPAIHHPLTGWYLTTRERARLMDWPDDFHFGSPGEKWDRYVHMRHVLFTGKAVPSAFPRFILPQLLRHLKRRV
jgi:site-specific DNA-cytosine methylase